MNQPDSENDSTPITIRPVGNLINILRAQNVYKIGHRASAIVAPMLYLGIC